MLSMPRSLFSIFAATRLALFAIGVFAVARMPINVIEAQGFHLPPQPHTFLEAWARYDACSYVTIAQKGYRGPIGPYGDMRAGFFPLFPALMAMVTPLVHTPSPGKLHPHRLFTSGKGAVSGTRTGIARRRTCAEGTRGL
jgi:hypothetical protein